MARSNLNNIFSLVGVRILAALFFLIGLVLVVGGGWLLSLGGSAYYLLAGAGLVASGAMLWRLRLLGAWIYVGVFAVTVAWALWEVGLNGWALVPRVVAPALLLAFGDRRIPRAGRTSGQAVCACRRRVFHFRRRCVRRRRRPGQPAFTARRCRGGGSRHGRSFAPRGRSRLARLWRHLGAAALFAADADHAATMSASWSGPGCPHRRPARAKGMRAPRPRRSRSATRSISARRKNIMIALDAGDRQAALALRSQGAGQLRFPIPPPAGA